MKLRGSCDEETRLRLQVELTAEYGKRTFVGPNGQVLVLTGTRPAIRKDGTPTTLYLWTGVCATCEAEFEHTTGKPPSDDWPLHRRYITRKRCPAHTVGHRAGARRAWAKKKTPIEDVESIG